MKWWRRRSGSDGDQVVGGGDPPSIPRPSSRTLAEDWLRALTITGEPGLTPQHAIALIEQVNKPETVQVRIRTPLPTEDARVLDETLAWYADVRSRQAGVNLLVEGLLIDWLAKATGQDRTAVVQRLALEVERLLPPE